MSGSVKHKDWQHTIAIPGGLAVHFNGEIEEISDEDYRPLPSVFSGLQVRMELPNYNAENWKAIADDVNRQIEEMKRMAQLAGKPIATKAYELCLEVENLPASEKATEISTKAGELMELIAEHEKSRCDPIISVACLAFPDGSNYWIEHDEHISQRIDEARRWFRDNNPELCRQLASYQVVGVVDLKMPLSRYQAIRPTLNFQ